MPRWSSSARRSNGARRGHGEVVAVVGEPGVGKSRLFHELTHSHRVAGCRTLQASAVSYGQATSYLPVIDLLKAYLRIDERDDIRSIRAKATGHLLTLDEALKDVVPPVLWLLDALPEEDGLRDLEPPQRRRLTLDAVKRLLLRESRVQPLVLVLEDLHWIDPETQALLDSLVESLPAAPVLLLVNYRPEYSHGWSGKTYYRQLRIDPLPAESAEELLQALVGAGAELVPAQASADRAHRGQPVLPRGECPDPGGDRNPRGRARHLPSDHGCPGDPRARRPCRRCSPHGSTGSRRRRSACSRPPP